MRPTVQCVPGLISEGKAVGRGVKHPPPDSVEVKESVELYLFFPPLGLHDLF
jgi:hypothetical protein